MKAIRRRDFLQSAGFGGGLLLSSGAFGSMLASCGRQTPPDKKNAPITPQQSEKKKEDHMPYELPKLPYAYNALEPVIDEQTMRLHHDTHHAGYVKGLNHAEEMIAAARQSGDYTLIKHWERELAFHGSGHILHTLFWTNLSPKGGGAPSGKLALAVNNEWGSFEAFQKEFGAVTKSVEGSGWGILSYNVPLKRLVILQAEKHQDLTQWGSMPLLVVDVWEHAYYLKYQSDRGAYVDNLFKIFDWKEVESRFDARAT